MKRGDVWLVSLDPTVGTEIQKTRPCLIISPDELNDVLRRVIIAPLTSRSHAAPFRVSVAFRNQTGLVLLDQIRTVDRKRLIKKLGTIDPSSLDTALTILVGMFSQ